MPILGLLLAAEATACASVKVHGTCGLHSLDNDCKFHGSGVLLVGSQQLMAWKEAAAGGMLCGTKNMKDACNSPTST